MRAPGPRGRATPASVGGFTLTELLVASVLFILISGVAFAIFRFTRQTAEVTLGAQVGLQTATRASLVKFIKEIQECIEVVRPPAGSTMDYFVARDKLNQILVVYPVVSSRKTASGGELLDLYLYRDDYGAGPPERNQHKVIEDIERVSFTALSSGVLQIQMTLHEQDRNYTLLTTVRTRNIVTEGEL